MDRNTSRRLVLSSIVTAGISSLTGCLNTNSGPSPGSLVITNEDSEEHVINVEVSKDEKQIKDEFHIQSSEKRTIEDYVPYTGRYTFSVKFDPDEQSSQEPLLDTGRQNDTQSETFQPVLKTPRDQSGKLSGHILRIHISKKEILTVIKKTPDN